MDIGEVLKYKPDATPKRPSKADPEIGEDRPSAPKRSKKEDRRRLEEEKMAQLEAEAAKAMAAGPSSVSTQEQIREMVDNLDTSTDEGNLDETKIKKLVLAFEKKATKNREFRIKFQDAPSKFMETEVELFGAISDLKQLAVSPDSYPLIVELGCVSSFLGILSHENTDLSVAMVDLIQDLTDVDTLNESEEGAVALVQSLVENQITALLVQNLERLNETVKEEADGVHNTLAIFENLIEFRPEICHEAAEAGLLTWLVKKLRVKVPFDDNKLYASEILSIFLQNEPKNRVKFGEMGTIDAMLQQLAYYKRHNPQNPEEIEMMENLFDCICSLLLHTPNRDRFLKGEGLQLMNLMLREKKLSRNGALKVLDHALTGAEGKESCIKFIDILGLRTIFPLFMKTPKKSKRKGVTADQHEEHCVSIVASLLKNCRGTTGVQRQRLLGKFTENNHEKVERLMELHFKYLDKVDASDEANADNEQDEEEDEDEKYLRRLDAGLFTLQLVDYIIADVSANADPSVKKLVLRILNQRNGSVQTIRSICREYAGNLGENKDGDKNEEAEKNGDENSDEKSTAGEQEKLYLLSLTDKF